MKHSLGSGSRFGSVFLLSLILAPLSSFAAPATAPGSQLECSTLAGSDGYVPCPLITWNAPTTTDYVGARSNVGSAVNPIDVPYDNAGRKACRYVDNESDGAIFVPFRSPPEWANFIDVPHDQITLTRCARATSFTINANPTKCTTTSPGFVVDLPYERAGNPPVLKGVAFDCSEGLYLVHATYTPEASTDGFVSHDGSGWKEELTEYMGGCGSADGAGTATEPSPSALCNGPGVVPVGLELSGSEWTWNCKVDGTAIQTGCSAPYSVQAKCAAGVDGVATSVMPSATLCDEGSATLVEGVGPWTWDCAAGASVAHCSAPSSILGKCGSADETEVSTKPSGGALCNGGEATTVSGTGPWTWDCVAGGVTDDCTAYPKAACGSSNGLALTEAPTEGFCQLGTKTNFVGGAAGPWTWACVAGPSTVNCSASKGSGPICGSKAGIVSAVAPTNPGLCSSGSASAPVKVSNSSPVAQWFFKWSCAQGGNSVECISPLCACAMCGLASGIPSATAPSLGLCGYGTLRVPPGVFLNTSTQWKWYCDDTPTSSAHACFAPKP
jgi:hypothetical protein